MAITYNSGENRLYIDDGVFTWVDVKAADNTNSWNVVNELGTRFSQCTAFVRVANGALTTLTLEFQAVQFDQPVEVASLGTFRAGALITNEPYRGCALVLNMNATYGIEPLGGATCEIQLYATRVINNHATAHNHVGHPTAQFQSDYRRATVSRVNNSSTLSRLYVGEDPTLADLMVSHQQHGLNFQQAPGTPGLIDVLLLHHLEIGVLVNAQTIELKGYNSEQNTTDIRIEGAGTVQTADGVIDEALIDHDLSTATTEIQNTVNLTVQDDTETAIQNARVTVYNSADEQQGSELTAADGTHTEIRATHTRHTGAGKPPATNTSLQPINVRAYFYPRTPFALTTTLSDRVEQTIAMLTNPFLVETVKATVLARTGITINEVSRTITISVNQTLQDIYEYAQAYTEDNPDNVDAPITTAEGVLFLSFYDFIINTGITVTATDQVLICQGSKTYTLNGTAQFTGIVGDQTKRRVPVVINGLVIGSRVLVRRDFDNATVIDVDAVGTEVSDFFEWQEIP